MKPLRVPTPILVFICALAALVYLLCATRAYAQNVEGQIIAAQYGQFLVPGSQAGAFVFPPALCQVSAGGQNFTAFAAGRPIKIIDSNPAHTEIATPSSVYPSVCVVNMATTYPHYAPYWLTSGTGGLQEAITANQTNNGVNSIILNADWYSLLAPGNAAAVISSVHGIASLGLVDVTQTPYVNYSWNGTVYVATGGGGSGGGSYNQGSAGAVTRSSTSKWQDTISIKDFGATGGNLALDTAGLQAAVAAATASGKSVYVPAGNYLLDNAYGPVLSGANNVLIWGDGPASSLACNTIGSYDCIQSTGATGFGLENLSISFTPTATTRSSGYAVNIETCTGCQIQDVALNNGDLSGLRLASSQHVFVKNLQITNFEANGAFNINDQDLRVDGLSCANNGDACFETSWFDSEYAAHAIPCQNITATNIQSLNDTAVLLINSCLNVSVDGFSGIGSAKQGVFIGQDPTTTTAHWPDRIAITNGTLYGVGHGSNPLNVATAPAILVNVVTTPPAGTISHIAISNLVATHTSSWGLQMAELQNDDLQLSNLKFYDVGNGNTTGCLQTQGNEINFAAISCTDSGTYGLYDQNTLRLTGTGLSLNASSQISGIDAIYLASTATGFVNLTNINIADTNGTTFSSEVYDASTTGQHSMWNISTTYATATGYLAPTSANGGTTYTYTDPGHSMVFRNGGMIQSFVPPNYYFLPTAGATPTNNVNGAVLYYQSKCWVSGGQQTESVGWLDQYPTLTTESFSFNHYGGCGFPITLDMTAANSVQAPLINSAATVSAQHFSGYAMGTYAAAPAFTAGTGAGTGPTLSANAQNNDLSGYISVTIGTSPAANAIVATGTFGVAYATLAKCSLWPANAAAAALTGASQAFVPVGSSTAFTILSGPTALTATTLYTWGYTCTQ